MHEPFSEYSDDEGEDEMEDNATTKDLFEFYDLLVESGTKGVGESIPFIRDHFNVDQFTATNIMMNWLLHFNYHITKN